MYHRIEQMSRHRAVTLKFLDVRGIGHLTNKKIGHLSNAKILQQADAQIGYLWYNTGEIRREEKRA